jgi:2-polyprenyl-3-methyl-5-hydroxy-6-metoxy-1,4-benzoquinol methylase
MDWKQFWETKARSGGPALQVGRVIGGVVLDDAWMTKIAARIAIQLDLQQEDNLLDVCCGNGALSRALLPYCHHMVGVDFSENLIEQAQSFEPNNIVNSTNTPLLISTKNKAFVARSTTEITKTSATNKQETALGISSKNAGDNNEELNTNNTPLNLQNNSKNKTQNPNISATNKQENELGISSKNAGDNNEELNTNNTPLNLQNNSNNNTHIPNISATNKQENELGVSSKNAGDNNEELNTNNTPLNLQNDSNNNTHIPNISARNSLENALGSDRKNEEMNLRQGLVDVGVGAKGEREKATINYVCGDASNFEVAERFEKICLYFSFQYFESQDKGMEVIANLVKHAKPKARILLGDIPDQRKFFVYYNSPRKMSSWLKQSVTGKNDMGKFWHPDELLKICNSLGVKAYVQEQESWQPYAKYRFDLLIKVGA